MITITKDNYFEWIKEAGFEKLPSALQESHEAITAQTNNGKDWRALDDDETFRSMSETAFKKLEEFIGLTDHSELGGIREEARSDTKIILQFISVDMLAEYFEKGYGVNDLRKVSESFATDKVAGKLKEGWIIINTVKNRKTHHKFKISEIYKLWQRFGASKKESREKVKKNYSNIQKEVYYIEWFLDFHDTIVPAWKLSAFIDELNQAIDDELITKKSPVASTIREIQSAAVNKYNSMKNATHFVLKPETIKRLKGIIANYENVKQGVKIKSLGKKKPSSLHGIEPAPQEDIMSSKDFANIEFKTIGLKDKWLDFIGDPSPGFSAMVFGMPKMGKSYLCVDFASYLSRNHGKVLYVSKEEYMSPTLAIKLKEKNAASENLYVSGSLPDDLSSFQFVFIDSVTSMKLTPDDLLALKKKYPIISFIYVFQVTKAGSARGTNEYTHNVDVVIQIPEKGKAIQYGRFNQGGVLDIFGQNDETNEEPSSETTLLGLGGKKNDWTIPKHMNSSDHARLKRIKSYVDEGEFGLAMELARESDTEIREAIPGEVWLAMGGQLTTSGYEKLRKRGFTAKEINKLEAKRGREDEEDREHSAEDSEPQPQVMSFMEYSKPKYRPKGKDIYPHVSSLNEINLALSCLRGTLEGRVIKKLKVGEYLEIVKIALRKHGDLFAFTEDVSSGLNDIVLRLTDSWEDWKNGVTAETVKPKNYPKRKGGRMNFVHSPGIDVLSLYYDKYIKKKGDKKFDVQLTEAVENDDLLYYNLAELERLFTRIKEQISNSKAA